MPLPLPLPLLPAGGEGTKNRDVAESAGEGAGTTGRPEGRQGQRGLGGGGWGSPCCVRSRAESWRCGRGALSTSALCLQAGPGLGYGRTSTEGAGGAAVLVWVKVVALPSSLPPPLPS